MDTVCSAMSVTMILEFGQTAIPHGPKNFPKPHLVRELPVGVKISTLLFWASVIMIFPWHHK